MLNLVKEKDSIEYMLKYMIHKIRSKKVKKNKVKMHKIKVAKKKKKPSRSRFVGMRRLMSNEDYPVAKCIQKNYKSICQNLQIYLSKLKDTGWFF